MSVKGYLALLVGVFVVALAVVGVSQRATAGAMPAILEPVAVTLAAVALAVLLIRLVLRDIARPFHSAGVDIRSNAEQSSGVAQTSATMEELARAAASIADTVDQVATQADTTRHNLEQAEFDIRASGERALAAARGPGGPAPARPEAGRGRPAVPGRANRHGGVAAGSGPRPGPGAGRRRRHHRAAGRRGRRDRADAGGGRGSPRRPALGRWWPACSPGRDRCCCWTSEP
jgi:hypothetical protein